MRLRTRSKLFVVILVAVIFVSSLAAEDITLEQCEKNAFMNHPLAKQSQFIELLKESDIEIANAQYLPKVTLSTKATRQSDTTSISNSLITIEGNLTQWQLVGEINQIVYDGGAIKAQKNAIKAESDIAKSQLDVRLEAVRSNVRETFFSVILIDSQQDQVQLLKKELSDTREKLTTYLANGVAIQSDIDAIKVEELKTKAKEIELETKRASAIYTLSQLTGMDLGKDTHLLRPEIQKADIDKISDLRKEFEVFQTQLDGLDVKQQVLGAGLYPKINVFSQIGYSQPGLNMLDPDPSAWWIVGIKGTFTLDNYYSYAANTDKISTTRRQIENQMEQFRLAERIKLQQKLDQIRQLEQALALDNEIIFLETSIKEAAEAKVANGVLSVSDLIQKLNEVTLAELTKAQHEVQLLLAQSELNLIEGNGDYLE
jgi:outer membrane protein TolC